MMRFLAAAGLLAGSAVGQAPTFQDLMDPGVFPEPQRDMIVEEAVIEQDMLRIITTGAQFTFDIAQGTAVLEQRIEHPRPLVELHVEGEFETAPELTHTGPGLAFARFATPRFDLRANGDSLFMIHAHERLEIAIKRRIDVDWAASYETNHVLFDELGGFALYCSDQHLNDAFDRFSPTTAVYTLPADAVLWVGACPPKPYPWERSIADHVVWHWSRQTGYPADEDLNAWADVGTIVLLQSEMMLWKDWNMAFDPRLGAAEFARVRETIHGNGMRFIVYTSPAYFFKGTPFEPYAMNTFEGFTGWPPCRGVGDNIDLFMAEIEKVMTQYKPDGLYFDGQYFESPAALYALARRTRDLLGEDGILEWHSTAALGHGLCFCPHADAYVDFILRGEGRDGKYEDFDYLRYFVSCYNTSNSIGVLCNNGPRPTSDLIERLLKTNTRLHTIASWLDDPVLMTMFRTHYRARLNAALRPTVEAAAAERQAQVARRAAELAAEANALTAPPVWRSALLVEAFAKMPEWSAEVSPKNGKPFAIDHGALTVRAKAHT
ncbi:MAG TPA: hypothetical protein ENN80_15000, partial [Candidatus Hydrogenedentes bacterium]|nr:hypothetical protein [Candidatus Hydrogenedentota bacterium]